MPRHYRPFAGVTSSFFPLSQSRKGDSALHTQTYTHSPPVCHFQRVQAAEQTFTSVFVEGGGAQ